MERRFTWSLKPLNTGEIGADRFFGANDDDGPCRYYYYFHAHEYIIIIIIITTVRRTYYMAWRHDKLRKARSRAKPRMCMHVDTSLAIKNMRKGRGKNPPEKTRRKIILFR